MKRNPLEKLGDFVLGKGFYIVLFLCVATIGISGYYLIRSVHKPAEPVEPVTGSPSIVLPDEDTAGEVPDVPAPTVQQPLPDSSANLPQSTHNQTPLPDDPQQGKEEQTPQIAPAPAPAVYTWPVKGEILAGYSVETLAYDPTMGDWRAHMGVDIAAAAGTSVLAVRGGTVADIRQDDLMGTTLVIDHGDGITSTYCGLSESPVVQIGDSVETGTVIGAVGVTAIAEGQLPAHLHLEMTDGDTAADPLEYLPK